MSRFTYQLAESAHLGDTVSFGQYGGLKKDTSAIEVATAIHEQLNGFDSRQAGGLRRAEVELSRRGFDTDGVKNSAAEGWNSFKSSERLYSELVNGSIDSCRRGDLTTEESLMLYTRPFDPSTSLTKADQIFLTGEKVDTVEHKNCPELTNLQPSRDALVKKATRLGIKVFPHDEMDKAKYKPLFHFDRRRPIPPGFEQINEDMFARKDNKFIVFNGSGVDSWTGNQPITKISHVENILLTTL